MEQYSAPRVGAMDKLTNWVNEPSIQTLKSDLEASKPSHDAQQAKINTWVSLLKVTGKAKPEVRKGRSRVQPKLIRRQAEWRYSALSEPFLGSDKLFSVKPATYEDTEAATQNELVLNWQFRTKIDKVKLIDEFVRATVDEGTCIIRTGWRRQTKMVKKMMPVWTHYPMETQEQAEALQQALDLRTANPRQYDETVPPEIKAAVEYNDESGEGTVAIQTGEEATDVELIIENRPIIEIMNPANVFIDPSCNGDHDKAMFVVFSFETSQADLLKEGKRYKQLNLVNWEGNSPLAEPDHSTRTPDDFNFKDPMRKKVVAYEYWGFFDIEGDGNLVPFVATWIGDVLIRMELNPFADEKLPFVVVNYLPVTRDLYGEPDAEVLEDNQAILGAVTRGMIDSMGRSANGQQGFAKGMLDPMNKRRFESGEDYEYNPNMPPTVGMYNHVYPELPQSALNMVMLQNQDAEAMTGVKSFSGGLSGDTYGKVATNTRGVLDAASKREMSILRRLVNGFVKVGNKIVAMNADFLSEKEVIRITNTEFVTVKREDLRGNFDLKVDISTAEIDNEKAQDLGFMLQTIGPNIDTSITMMVLAEIATLKQMPKLAKTLKDWKPQPDPMAEQMKQLQLQEQQLKNAVLESQVALNNAKAQREVAMKDQADLDFVEQESGTKHMRNLEETKAQAKGNQALMITKALTTARKEGEKAPDLDAAIGFNSISDKLGEAA